jgi:hypothetical protein
MTAPDLKAQIAREIYIALERLGADEELLAIIGSWRDTLPDAEVLSLCAITMSQGGRCIRGSR